MSWYGKHVINLIKSCTSITFYSPRIPSIPCFLIVVNQKKSSLKDICGRPCLISQWPKSKRLGFNNVIEHPKRMEHKGVLSRKICSCGHYVLGHIKDQCIDSVKLMIRSFSLSHERQRKVEFHIKFTWISHEIDFSCFIKGSISILEYQAVMSDSLMFAQVHKKQNIL